MIRDRLVEVLIDGQRYLRTRACAAETERLVAEGAHRFAVGDRVSDGRDTGTVVGLTAWNELRETASGLKLVWSPGYCVKIARRGDVLVWPEAQTSPAAPERVVRDG